MELVYSYHKFRIELIALCLIICSSCTPDEGVGGRCSIKGRLIEKAYNDDMSVLQRETIAKDEDVFLLFGDETSVGEKTSSSFYGDFEFNHLWPGTYTLYYYSEGIEKGAKVTHEKTMEIKLSGHETVDLGELEVIKLLDYDDGAASIHGRVMVTNYRNSSAWPNLIVKDVTPAQEQEVYLVYANHKQYDERIRTNHDGTFAFTNLIKGDYKIYVYSEDVKGGTQDVVVEKQITVTEENQDVELDEINIEKL
ncbi:hypothetical protein EYV94_05125 [Puteibacter caeruleilacunae]|nr:hypothetical protein EYV94_05125 [Puteibacter caeruleilacunae]